MSDRTSTFFVGAATGFVAGAFVMSLVIWQLGTFSRVAAVTPADTARTAHKTDGDFDTPVLEKDDAIPTSGSVPPGTNALSISAPPAAELGRRDLEIPVEGVKRDELTRTFEDKRGTERRHEAIDILAPRNTPVRAVEDGTVAKLFISKAGGITVYQFDPTEQFCYYYAHLERYADGLREGARLRKGQVIGYVGTSGNAPKDTPHLHFAIFRLTSEKHWWEGTPLDPYDVLHR